MRKKRHRPGRSVYVRQDTKKMLLELAEYQGVSIAKVVASLAVGARDRLPERWRKWKEAHRAA